MMRKPCLLSGDLFNLRVFQFHRRGAAENGDRNLEAGFAFVHFLDNAVEGSEGAVGNGDKILIGSAAAGFTMVAAAAEWVC